jgi:hypothetical protein
MIQASLVERLFAWMFTIVARPRYEESELPRFVQLARPDSLEAVISALCAVDVTLTIDP